MSSLSSFIFSITATSSWVFHTLLTSVVYCLSPSLECKLHEHRDIYLVWLIWYHQGPEEHLAHSEGSQWMNEGEGGREGYDTCSSLRKLLEKGRSLHPCLRGESSQANHVGHLLLQLHLAEGVAEKHPLSKQKLPAGFPGEAVRTGPGQWCTRMAHHQPFLSYMS